MRKTAYCKINLTLEILGTQRNDGFHDIKTVMHKIPLGDEIELCTKEGKGEICFFCDSDVCNPEQNLAYRAAQTYLDKYFENTGKTADVDIKLWKTTPTGAGLGGGSADAACVLDMLYGELAGGGEDDVLEMAQELGSDVPFCLDRYKSAFCTGRGEICRSINTLPSETAIVIAKPLEGINTKGIYGEYDKNHGDDYSKCDSERMESALKMNDLRTAAKCIMNDFESVCIPRLPEIEEIKRKMLSTGALCSQMSGSGSAVFGLFDNDTAAEKCCDSLKNDGLSEVYCFGQDSFEKMYKGE